MTKKHEELYRELKELKILYNITLLFLEEEINLQKILQESAEIINSVWKEKTDVRVVITYGGLVADSNGSSNLEDNTPPAIAVKFNNSPFGELRIYKETKAERETENSEAKVRLSKIDRQFLNSVGNKLSMLILNKERQEQRKNTSYQDPLTSLYNRRFFQKEMERLDTDRQLPISFIMLDVNGLKLVNDGFGHMYGDKLLTSTADILQNSVRGEDIIARWGGDEFIIMLPQTTREQAKKIGTRIEELCRETVEDKIPISLGMGISTKVKPEEDLNQILVLADENMYMHKHNKASSSEQLMISAMIKHLSQKSDETEGHIVRVTNCLEELGKYIGLQEYQLEDLALLAQLHDIGKIYIPEKILKKPEELNKKEWSLIKKHPEKGYRLALGTDKFAHIADKVYSHHEHWDGSGYPRGLKGEDIPLLARIFMGVEAYDVMTSERSYSPEKSEEEARQELQENAGSQFDPYVVGEFISLVKSKSD